MNKLRIKNKNIINVREILMSFVLLFTVYSIEINTAPNFFDFRIFTMMIVIVAVSAKSLHRGVNLYKYNKPDFHWVLSVFSLFLYVIVIALFRNGISADKSVVPFVFNYISMVVIFSFFSVRLFKDIEEFNKCLIIATVFQSIIVIASFAIPSVRSFLFSVQSLESNQYYNRIVGLGLIGAKGSIYLFAGLISNAYVILFQKYKMINVFSFIIIFIAIILVGRTGFYLSGVILLFMLFSARENLVGKLRFYKRFVFASVLLGVIGYLLLFRFGTSINLDMFFYTIRRLNEIVGSRRTFEVLSEMEIPPLSLETFFGIGVIKGYLTSGQLIWHDSGFVQSYLSMGVVGALIFYLGTLIYILSLISKIRIKKIKMFYLLITIMMFVIEYKEPFMFALSYPFVLIVMIKLTIRKKGKVNA